MTKKTATTATDITKNIDNMLNNILEKIRKSSSSKIYLWFTDGELENGELKFKKVKKGRFTRSNDEDRQISLYLGTKKDVDKESKFATIIIPKKDDNPDNDNPVPQPSERTPEADAGSDIEYIVSSDEQLQLPKTFELDGSGSRDSYTSIATYLWSIIGDNALPENIEITDHFAKKTLLQIKKKGTYKIKLRVKNQNGLEDDDYITATVDTGNLPPPPQQCPPGQHRDENDNCVPDVIQIGELLYDSNIHGQWNNGVARTVEDSEGDQSANGKGLYTAASGNPKLHIQGDGTAILECDDGHGRIYLKVCNHNTVLETEFSFLDDTVENFSQKIRSRHQMGGSETNRFGGVGNSIARSNVGMKIEKFHNEHEQGFDEILSKKLELNKWYKSRFTVKDTEQGIYQKSELDYNDGNGFITVAETTFKNPLPYYIDKDLSMKESECWLRLNGSGRIAIRNVTIKDIT